MHLFSYMYLIEPLFELPFQNWQHASAVYHISMPIWGSRSPVKIAHDKITRPQNRPGGNCNCSSTKQLLVNKESWKYNVHVCLRKWKLDGCKFCRGHFDGAILPWAIMTVCPDSQLTHIGLSLRIEHHGHNKDLFEVYVYACRVSYMYLASSSSAIKMHLSSCMYMYLIEPLFELPFQPLLLC